MKLTLQNFRCYENQTFDLGDEGLSLLTGPSGSGKSSILIGINFALYGKGTKLIQKSKTKCKVELEFDGIKIVRTKGPNRLLVNDVYEDDSGQEIINTKFGEMFDITGYMSQNAVNSFIHMSPNEKLGFIEQFAFHNTTMDLTNLKISCKDLIRANHDQWVRTSSQLEMIGSILQEIEVPEKVLFPFRCTDRAKGKVNETVRCKNCSIRIKRCEKAIETSNAEMADLKILNALTFSNQQACDRLDLKINKVEDEKSGIVSRYQGDVELERNKNRLSRFLARRLWVYNEEKYQEDYTKLARMQTKEREQQEQERQTLTDQLWKEYSLDETETLISEYENYLKDSQKLGFLKKEQVQLGDVKTVSFLESSKSDLGGYMDDLEEARQGLSRVQLQEQLHTCPSCASKLRFCNETLVLSDTVVSIEKSKPELEMEMGKLKKRIRKLESEIPREEAKLQRSVNIEREIQLIQDQYEEELGSFMEIKSELDSLHEYKRTQKEMEKRMCKLDSVQYSESVLSFEKDVQKLKDKIDGGKTEGEEEDEIVCEETIREAIYEQEQLQKEVCRLKDRLHQLYIEKESSLSELETMQGVHLRKYKSVCTFDMIQQRIDGGKDAIVSWKAKQTKHQNNLTQIERYEQYCEAQVKYQEWVGKQKQLKGEEREKRERYDGSKILLDKILQAESISIMNIIDSINIHAQVYLDSFFTDEPICVQIVPFKENKKKKQSKPQLTILIEYKGMECDTGMLSGGELARVTLAYTLALAEMFSSSLLMLDESTSNLDQGLTDTVFQSIRDNFNGKLVIVVAHQVVTGTFDQIIKLI